MARLNLDVVPLAHEWLLQCARKGQIGMESSEKYAAFTKSADWTSICQLNGVQLDSFGTKRELARLPEYLEKDEIVYALTSGMVKHSETSNGSDFGSNTWLVTLTNERFLFLDAALMTKSVDVQSVRLNRVQAVSSSQGWVLGKIMVDLGSRVLTIDNCQKDTVKIISDIANKILRPAEKSPAASQSSSEAPDDFMSKLERLATLHSAGALTPEEFSAAKAKILNTL